MRRNRSVGGLAGRELNWVAKDKDAAAKACAIGKSALNTGKWMWTPEVQARHEEAVSQFGNLRDFRRSICTGSQKLVNSPRVQRCLDKAAYCREMAAVATDCTAKAAFEDAACCWRELATLLEWLDQG